MRTLHVSYLLMFKYIKSILKDIRDKLTKEPFKENVNNKAL